MSTDAELLERYAKEKSEAAFAELVQRHLSLVYSSALRLLGGDGHLAQDVAQTVFTALARKASSLASRTALAGWLYLSTHHAAAQVVRSDRRRQVREQEAYAMQQLSASSLPPADWDRVRPVLDDALRALSDADREAVLLRYFERRPFAEIGATLHLTDDAARMRVERALEKLKRLLERRGITSTTTALAVVFANQAMVAAPTGFAATVASTALAGAGAAAATGFFMSSTIAIISAVAVAAVGSAVYEINQVHRAEAATSAISSERDALRTRLGTLQQQVNQSDQQIAALQVDVGTLRSNKAEVATKSLSSASTTVTFTPGDLQRREEESKLKQMQAEISFRRQGRIAALDTTYRALYRQLGFTADQSEQFKAIMTETMRQNDEQLKALFAAGKPDPATLQAINDQTNADLQAKLRSAFGDAAYQTIQHFNDTLPVRSAVEGLATNMFYTDAPLTAAQADQLVEILANNTHNAEGRISASAITSASVDSILMQAQSVLTTSQLAEFRRLTLQDLSRRQNEQRVLSDKQNAERMARAGGQPSGG